MSEGKLYAVKNDEGRYWDFEDQDWELNVVTLANIIAVDDGAKCIAHDHGGHVVAFVEEPKKVVLSKEQAEIVETARVLPYPASYISQPAYCSGNERLLIKALVNGYTVAKEKKYNVKVPHTKEVWYYKSGDTDLLTICPADKELCGKFTESDIDHYGLQDCEKEEVTDDEQ